jgi:Fe-S cluster assembly protein SufD
MAVATGLAPWIGGLAEPDWLLELRRQAAEAEAAQPLPRWDRTDVSGLHLAAFASPARGGVRVAVPEEARAAGVVAGPLAEVASAHPDLVRRHLGRLVDASAGKFEARNLAAHEGVLVYVPDRVAVPRPLEVTYRAPAAAGAQYHPRTVVVLGRSAELGLVQRLEGGPGEGEGEALVTEVVEAWLEEDAHLRFVDLQAWGEGVRAFANRRAELARAASVEWLVGELGAALTRAGTTTVLRGEGSEARSLLVFFASGRQHMDVLATLHHLGRRTDGLILARGVLKDQARTVYRGTSDIERDAKGSNSQQKENTLHLTPGVRSEAIPALYIDENELSAGHAATTGKIDPEQMFYLRSRGLPEREAERLIVHGFFAPLLSEVRLAEAREAVAELIDRKLDRGTVAGRPEGAGGGDGR